MALVQGVVYIQQKYRDQLSCFQIGGKSECLIMVNYIKFQLLL